MCVKSQQEKGSQCLWVYRLLSGVCLAWRMCSSFATVTTCLQGTRRSSQRSSACCKCILATAQPMTWLGMSSASSSQTSLRMQVECAEGKGHNKPLEHRARCRASQLEFSRRWLAEGSPSVLLIDEVDVFFGPQFQGASFRGLSKLSGQTCAKLLRWGFAQAKARNTCSIEQVKGSSEFAAFLRDFPLIPDLADVVARDLSRAITGFDSHLKWAWHCNGKSIGYKDDRKAHYNYTRNFGTCTRFLYLHRNEKQQLQLTADEFEELMFVSLTGCTIPFAELPNHFDVKLGLTGGFRCLHKRQKKPVEDEVWHRVGVCYPVIVWRGSGSSGENGNTC